MIYVACFGGYAFGNTEGPLATYLVWAVSAAMLNEILSIIPMAGLILTRWRRVIGIKCVYYGLMPLVVTETIFGTPLVSLLMLYAAEQIRKSIAPDLPTA